MNTLNSNNGRNILLSAYACSPIRGSEPGNGWNWATGLAKKGFNVWCFTNVEDKECIITEKEKLDLPNLHFVFVPLKFRLDEFLLDTNSKKIYLHYLLWQKKAGIAAKKLHAKINFDTGHHVTFGSLQQGTFLWKLKNITKVFGPVGGGQEAMPVLKDYFGNAWKIERIRNFISKWSVRFSTNFKNTVRYCDHILVTNPDTRKMALSVKNADPSKISFIADTAVPPSMQQINFKVKEIPAKVKILWVGRFLPRKGLNFLLDALSHVPADVNYEFTIVGGGEQFHLLDQWIEQYGVDRSKLTICGQLPFKEVLQHYQQADVFAFCSLRDSFAAQLIEAMAFGLPIITLNIHGPAIAVPADCGIKVPVTSKDETVLNTAKAIEKMCRDHEFRIQCSINSYNNSTNYTWENKINSVITKYYNL